MELTGRARLAVTERERRRFGLDGPVGLRRKGRKEGERSGLGWKGKKRKRSVLGQRKKKREMRCFF